MAGYEPFYNAVGSDANMTQFAENAVTYLRAAGMDGLDMDWEFPGSRGSPPEDKYQFTKLMKVSCLPKYHVVWFSEYEKGIWNFIHSFNVSFSTLFCGVTLLKSLVSMMSMVRTLRMDM